MTVVHWRNRDLDYARFWRTISNWYCTRRQRKEVDCLCSGTSFFSSHPGLLLASESPRLAVAYTAPDPGSPLLWIRHKFNLTPSEYFFLERGCLPVTSMG
jgi:hypothetical protein